MVGISIGADSKTVEIYGHGLTVAEPFELVPDIWITPNVKKLDLETTVKGCRDFIDYAAVLHGNSIASFVLRIEQSEGGRKLGVKAWNALWIFHLLSVAIRRPCFSLYAMTDGERVLYSSANRNPFAPPLNDYVPITAAQLQWAQQYFENFNELINIAEFSAAMRCYGNAHALPDHDVRIMLLWAGIEGLLNIDAELSRRVALYSAILHDGDFDEKVAYYDRVKKAYGVRSRAVHGSGLTDVKVRAGSAESAAILVGILAKCVELGRVPSANELDRLAISSCIS